MGRLTAAHRKARLDLAYKYGNRDWRQVLFSGEIEVHSFKIWVLISYYWPPRMRILNGGSNSTTYISILEEIVTPMLNLDENLVFMQVRNQNYFQFLHVDYEFLIFLSALPTHCSY